MNSKPTKHLMSSDNQFDNSDLLTDLIDPLNTVRVGDTDFERSAEHVSAGSQAYMEMIKRKIEPKSGFTLSPTSSTHGRRCHLSTQVIGEEEGEDGGDGTNRQGSPLNKANFNRMIRPQTQGATHIGGGRIKLTAKVSKVNKTRIGTSTASGLTMALDD